MSAEETYVVVGAGLAAAKAVETLREEGFDGRIVLLGAEDERPYERPPLSKGYLLGTAERDSIYPLDAGWYAGHDVDLRLGTTVSGLDPRAHEVTTASGERVHFDRLLLSTGASPRRLRLDGADLDGVHYLRTVTDSDRLRAELEGGGRRVVVIGAGWIGLETAAAAKQLGNDVTVVEFAQTPLYAVLGPELGEVFGRLHRDHGVRLLTGTGVREFLSGGSRVAAVVTDGGETLPADVVIVGVGVRPNTELAEAGGLHTDNGVVVGVDRRSSHPDVYAAGDVANAFDPRLDRHLRVEHWANARHSGVAAARSMLGQAVSEAPIPYFFSDQYDLGMEYSGFAGPGDYDRVVHRGDLDGRQFVAFWLSDRRVVAGMNVNVWDVNDAVQALIRGGARVDPRRLADPDVPLDAVAADGTG